MLSLVLSSMGWLQESAQDPEGLHGVLILDWRMYFVIVEKRQRKKKAEGQRIGVVFEVSILTGSPRLT